MNSWPGTEVWRHSPGTGSEALLCQRTGKEQIDPALFAKPSKGKKKNFIRADFLFLYSLVLITCIMVILERYSFCY